MKAVIVVCGLLMLGGCASGGASNPPWLALNSRCAKLSGDQELSMNLADDMAKEGKLHASLANLQSLPERYGQVQLRKARLYRQLGRSEAELLASASKAARWLAVGGIALAVLGGVLAVIGLVR